MELSASFDVIGPVLQISLIDLLLSGDNAILIALACRNLPEDLRRKAVFVGTGAAVVFRVFMTFAATLALRAPYLKLIGAVLLLLIAIELLASDESGQSSRYARGASADAQAGMWRAVVMVVVADAVMSLDNVVAIAAAAQDNVWFLAFGLLLSVPILVFSSLFVTRLLDAHPLLVQGGAALLGWIAGRTAVSDPAFGPAMADQSFGLVALAPVLGAAYVLWQGRILREQRAARAEASGRYRAAPDAVAAPAAAPQAPAREALPDAAWGPAPADSAHAPMPPARAPDPVVVVAAAATVLAAPQVAPIALAASVTAAPAGPEAADAQATDQPQPLEAPPAAAPLKKLGGMDLTIMAGVAVPALGLVATLIYIIVKMLGAR